MTMITPQGQEDHLVNPEMIKLARAVRGRFPALLKAAFIPGGDPSMGGGAPPGGDPSMGGMPPGGDPSMGGGAPPGGDPSAGMGMGGGPPMDPSMMMPPPPPGGGGGDPAMMGMLTQILQAIQGGGGAGGVQSGANAAGQLKPKIDVNVAIMQISKMLARIADALGVQIPASEMIATPNDLTGMANKQQAGGQQDASMGAGGGGPGGTPGGMPPMPGMEAGPGAMPGGKAASDRTGRAYSHAGLEETSNKATAILRMRQEQRRAG